ncbi:glycosyltransferase family 4 protein [Fictibacillus fluitans]|uniref:Glycosyltransferase family 4 protein n=1 Tax=Fictibacillus fluitans TaxID=3058422 RepID=A0ABT8HT48_9BACL|nr:glycosyltransferase family 4 protein [Fictibacillus sp. NE201]MDN4523953.1 glycosyltransferase family 4 protein [Fictibacillus sp. NE201]
MKSKKKIVFVINYFYPDFASTGQLMTELCMSLQQEFNITVIAAQPGYAGEDIKSTKKFEVEQMEKMKIIRIKLPKVDKTSKLSRIKYITSYFIYAQVVLLKERNVDLIYTISQPPIIGGLIGTIGKWFKRSKHVYNIQDFNPEQAAAVSYTNKQIVFKVAKKIDMLNCSYADKVIVVGNDMCKTLHARYANKRLPSHAVINNWTNEEEIVPLNKTNSKIEQFLKGHNLENKFIVMYSGNIGLFYDLENIIKVTENFKDQEEIAFVFIGEGAVKKDMLEFVKRKGISNVYFLPYQSKEFIKYSLNAADVHLVVNQKGIKGVSVPSKIYGVMAAGKPILGVLEQGSEAQMLIEKSNNGLVIEPQDYEGITKAINQFYQMEKGQLKSMGLNGRAYLDKHLKRKISINKYREVLNDVLEG